MTVGAGDALRSLAGDTAVVDFTGSSAQVDGPVNANLAVTTAATMYVFRCLVREEIPFTSGISRPIRIVAPEGSIVNAGLRRRWRRAMWRRRSGSRT